MCVVGWETTKDPMLGAEFDSGKRTEPQAATVAGKYGNDC
jgi:hypothetical protein